MTNNLKNIFLQIFHTISSNFVKIVVTGILTIIIPKFFSVESYGYWQLYIFYTSYVGFFHLGWCDGIYLKEGGKNFNDLNFSSYKNQFFSLVFFQICICILIVISSNLLTDINHEKLVILIGVCFNAIIVTPCTMLNYLMQATDKIKEFSYSTILGRVTYFSLVCLGLFFHIDFEWIIIADLIGWSITLIYSCFMCKKIFMIKAEQLSTTILEILNNINIGIKLMIANIASTLIIGIVRMAIEANWGIEVFGKISLSINFCNLALIFINSVSIVLYPILKRIGNNDLNNIYQILDNIFLPFLFISLTLFFPIKIFISVWLPQYESSLVYMAILFPICIYESKISLLIYTFFKVLRKEKIIMLVNLGILSLSFIGTYLFVYILHELTLTIYLILFLLFLRCVIFEILINKYIQVSVHSSIFSEFFVTAIFLTVTLNLDILFGFLLYLALIVVYFIFNSKKIFFSLKNLKFYMNRGV